MQEHEVDATATHPDAGFEVAVRRAEAALEKSLTRRRYVVLAVLAAGVLVSLPGVIGLLTKSADQRNAVLGAMFPGSMVLSILICIPAQMSAMNASAVAGVLGHLAHREHDFFFVSPRCGLVIMTPAGVFVERRLRRFLPNGGFLPYYDRGRRVDGVGYVKKVLVSVWHDEERHVLSLRTSLAIKQLISERESFSTFHVPLPRGIAPALVLERAVQANRRAQAA